MTAAASATQIPAFALIGAGSELLRWTDGFHQHLDVDGGPNWDDIDRVVKGEIDHAVVTLDGVSAEVEAVTDPQNRRRALLSLVGEWADGEGNALLNEPLDEVPAIVYLKDLDGRYLRVNRRYTECLKTSEERVSGHADAELPRSETIDGPRLGPAGEPVEEPLQLEYIVQPFEERPALAVMRFAVRNRDGEPVAVCGVAGPLTDADTARAECARLMRIERWSRVNPGVARTEMLEEWGVEDLWQATPQAIEPEATAKELEAQKKQISALHEASAAAARRAHELVAELESERERAHELERALGDTQKRLDDLESAAHSGDAERERLQAEMQHRLAVLEQQLAAAQAQLSERDAQLTAAHDRQSADDSERQRLVDDLEQARAQVEEWRERAESTTAAFEATRDADTQRLAEMEQRLADLAEQLAAADEQMGNAEAERSRLQDELEHTKAESEQQRHRVEEAEASAARADEELAGARAQLTAAEDQLTHAEERLAAAERQQRADEAERGRLQAELERAQTDLTAKQEQLQSSWDELDAAREQLAAVEQAQAASEQDVTQPLRWSAAAQRKLAGALAGASEWRTGLKDAVRILGSEGGWDVVTTWAPDGRGSLRCAAMWTADAEFAPFETLTWQLGLPASGTQLAMALRAPDPMWLADLAVAADRHLKDAAAHGLRSALLVPIRNDASPIGLLEFLTRTAAPPHADLSASLEAVALQLGHFARLLRLGAQPHWRVGRM